ncbi:MAG: PilN domain-containing protein [Geitlerinemataceae cyanobacterium]
MYSIDINFLKDREPIEPRKGPSPSVEIPGKAALLAGGGVALAFLAAVGGYWAYLNLIRIPVLEKEKQELETQLNAYIAKQQELQQITTETNLIQQQAKALATVFDYVKPWSALMQDLRDRTPPGVRISQIEQLPPDPASAPPPPAAGEEGQAVPVSAPPLSPIEVSGTAASFTDVNDLVIMLQRSSFLDGSKTRLVTSELKENPSQEVQASEANFDGELGQVVEYTIQTQLSTVPASQQLNELQRKGAVGLVKRIRQLQEIGVLQNPG